MEMKSLWNRYFIAISIGNFFQFMTFQALLATLPLFVLEKLNGNENQIGFIMASFMIGSIMVRPFAGKWLHKLGKKRMLFFSLFLFLLATLSYLWVHDFYILLLIRIVHGLSFGIASTASATLAVDYIPLRKRGEGMGYFSASVSLAMVIGPFLGLMLIDSFSFTFLFSICILFSFISFGSVLFLKEHMSKTESNHFSSKGIHSFFEANAIPIALSACFLSFVFGGVNSFISVYAKDLHMPKMASYFFMTYAIVVLVFRPIVGKLFDRFGGNYIIYIGSAFFFTGILCLSQSSSPFSFILSSVFIGCGFGSITPSLQTLAILSASTERVGLATATYFCFFDFGLGLGSILLGSIASHTSFPSMYLFSSFFIVIGIFVYYGFHHQKTA